MNQTVVNPMPLHNLDEIKAAFRVSDDTVRLWIKEGAPIVRLPKSLHAEYSQLVNWLVNTYTPTQQESQ